MKQQKNKRSAIPLIKALRQESFSPISIDKKRNTRQEYLFKNVRGSIYFHDLEG